MNKKELKQFIANAYQDAYDKNPTYNELGVIDHMLKYCNYNYKDNPVPSIDNFTRQELSELLNIFECEDISNWNGNEKLYYSIKNKLQNGVETDKEEPKYIVPADAIILANSDHN